MLYNCMTRSLDGQDKEISAQMVVGAISALIRSEHRHAAHLARTMELPAADMLALYHLANEPLSATVLGDRLGLTSGSVTALVDRLIARKLAKRRPHETDRRVVLIEMTKTGHTESWEQLQFFVRGTTHLCEQLKPSERRTVEHFLQSLVSLVDGDTDRMQQR
jgi:DNA-binding MarR family transcriptional regulator